MFVEFVIQSTQHINREKQKARELRKSVWWKNQIGKGKCHYCNEMLLPSQLTMDHRIPLIRGGKSNKKNSVPCCKKCNNSKKYLLPNEWNNIAKLENVN